MVAMTAGSDEPVQQARILLPDSASLSREIIATIEVEIPEFAEDPRLRDLLNQVVHENVRTVIQALEDDVPMELVTAPPAAIEHAVILAQRHVPITVLLKAYRLGQSRFLEGVFERVPRVDVATGSAVMDLVRRISTYIDKVSTLVELAYDRERELVAGTQAALNQHWVSELMTGQAPDIARAEATLRYRLRGFHVALEIWADAEVDVSDVGGNVVKLGRLIQRSDGLTAGHLLVPTDTHCARIWLPVKRDFQLDPATLLETIESNRLPIRVAIGDKREGVEGFRTSARSAKRVKQFATSMHPTPRVLSYEAVAPMTLLIDDPGENRHFIDATLGDLGKSGQRNEGLRETLRVYLESNRSFHHAADLLHVHRNTVHYRVQQAIDMLGYELGPDTLRLQLALTMCRWRSLFVGPDD